MAEFPVSEMQTLQEDLVSALPAGIAAILMLVVWRLICLWLCRHQQSAWHTGIDSLKSDTENASLDEQIMLAQRRLIIMGRGSPTDRLFFAGMVVALVLVVLASMLRMMLVEQG